MVHLAMQFSVPGAQSSIQLLADRCLLGKLGCRVSVYRKMGVHQGWYLIVPKTTVLSSLLKWRWRVGLKTVVLGDPFLMLHVRR